MQLSRKPMKCSPRKVPEIFSIIVQSEVEASIREHSKYLSRQHFAMRLRHVSFGHRGLVQILTGHGWGRSANTN